MLVKNTELADTTLSSQPLQNGWTGAYFAAQSRTSPSTYSELIQTFVLCFDIQNVHPGFSLISKSRQHLGLLKDWLFFM